MNVIAGSSIGSSSDEQLYSAADLGILGSTPQIVDSAGNAMDASSLTALYDADGNYIGSYGFDPESGFFSAWDAVGNETSFNELVATAGVPTNAVPVAYGGKEGLLYNSQGQLIGANVAGYANAAVAPAGESISGLVQVRSTNGVLIGSFGAYGDSNFGVWDANGNYTDATSILIAAGFTSDQISSSLSDVANEDAQESVLDDDDIQNALTNYLLTQGRVLQQTLSISPETSTVTSAVDPNGEQSVLDAAGDLLTLGAGITGLYDATGNYIGSYGIDPSTGYFSSWDENGNETNLSSLIGGLQPGATPIGATGTSAIVFNQHGQVVGINVAGSLASSSGASSVSGLTQVRNSAGDFVGSFGVYEGEAGPSFGLWSANGTYNDATTILQSLGFNAQSISAAISALGSGAETGTGYGDASSIEAALAQYLLVQGQRGSEQTSDALTSLADDLSGGTSGAAQTAGVAITSVLAKLANGSANAEQVSIFNALVNQMTFGNTGGEYYGTPTTSGSALDLTATLIGGLILSNGAQLNSSAVAFLGAGAALQLYQDDGEIAELLGESLSNAYDTSAIGESLQGSLSVALASQSGAGYSAALEEIFDAGAPGDAATLADGLLLRLEENTALGDAGAASIASTGSAQLAQFSLADISTLSVQQVAALTDDQVGVLSAAQIGALLPQQVAVLTSDQLQNIALNTMSGVSGNFFNALSSTQIASLSSAQIAAFAAEEVPQLSTLFIASLSSSQVAALTAGQIESLTGAQINALSNQQVYSLSASQISAFTSDQLAQAGVDAPEYELTVPPLPRLFIPPPPPNVVIGIGPNYANGSSLDTVNSVLNGTDLQVQLMAHNVNHTGYLHVWIQITSKNASGVEQSYTLSFEPSDENAGLVALFNGDTNLDAVLDADDQHPIVGLDQNVIVPYNLLPPGTSPTATTATQAALKAFATALTDQFFAYRNGSEKYYAMPSASPSARQYNSNSGIATILTNAGYNINGIDVTFNQYASGNGLELPNPGQTVPLTDFAPGWLNRVPLKDFSNDLVGIVNQATTTNPVTALLNTPYVRNLILSNPNFAGAFVGNLAALQGLVQEIEGLQQGGVLNVITGGLDLPIILADLNIIPKDLLSSDVLGWLEHRGPAAATDILAIVSGFEEGGVEGGIETGIATDQLVWLMQPLFQSLFKIALSGAVATPIAIVAGLVALVLGGNHDNPAEMPDKYDTARFTQYVGELQGSAGTAYAAPYDPSSDAVQQALGGESMLQYIETWAAANQNSSNTEVQQEAQQLISEYGDTGNGTLSFAHDIGDEAVVGGTLSGTYVSLHDEASEAIGEIQLLDAMFPVSTVAPESLQAPSQDYGGLAWTPFILPTGDVGYWASDGAGEYYYFGPDNTLYHDSYPGEVQPGDLSNAVGNVTSYTFPDMTGVDASSDDGGGGSSYYYAA